MQVWIVITGEQQETCSIYGVYREYTSALEVATRLADPENPHRSFQGRETSIRNGDNENEIVRFEWACDYVAVEVWNVREFHQ